MGPFHAAVLRVGKAMDWIGGIVLTLMMLITVLDVIMRYAGRPITGTYELVFLGGAVVIGAAIPVTSWVGGHVSVDLIFEVVPRAVQISLTVFTKLLGMAFFFLLGWNLFALGTTLYQSGEVSLTLHVPYYPVAYTLGVCAFVEVFVLLSMLIRAVSGGAHE